MLLRRHRRPDPETVEQRLLLASLAAEESMLRQELGLPPVVPADDCRWVPTRRPVARRWQGRPGRG